MVLVGRRLGNAEPDSVFDGQHLFAPDYAPSTGSLFRQESKAIRVQCRDCWLLLVSNAESHYLPLASGIIYLTHAPAEVLSPLAGLRLPYEVTSCIYGFLGTERFASLVEGLSEQLAAAKAALDWTHKFGARRWFPRLLLLSLNVQWPRKPSFLPAPHFLEPMCVNLP